MSNKLDLKQEIKAEKGKFKSLPFGEKLTYIKDYYSVHIIAVVIIIIAAYAIFITYRDKNFNTVLYAVLINNDKSLWSEDVDSYEYHLSKPFADYLGIDNDKDRIVIDNNYILDTDRDEEMSVYSAESLVAMFYGKHIDIHIGNELSVQYFCQDDDTFFYPLNTIFDEEFLEKYKDRIYYHTYADGTKVPVAFDITDCSFTKDASLTVNPVLIAVFCNTERLDTATEYIRFILDQE